MRPLLFLLFINDITESITSEIRFFADDCILYRTISSPTDADLLQKDLDMLTEWEIRWQMSFNQKKCHIMHISNLRSREVLYDYTMRGSKLEVVYSYPYLVVTISSNLKWNDHVNNVIKKASRSLGMLRRNISMCSKDTKSMAYNTLFDLTASTLLRCGIHTRMILLKQSRKFSVAPLDS